VVESFSETFGVTILPRPEARVFAL
jgi:hypothetical protein